jgi:hypothetical protein
MTRGLSKSLVKDKVLAYWWTVGLIVYWSAVEPWRSIFP